MNITRTLEKHIKRDLKEKMVFIAGPRQVGKTTLAKFFIKSEEQYFSWDDLNDRSIIKKHQIDPTLKIVILDEIHKYARWRMLLKGLFDKYASKLKILVTGSAQLDYFRKGGDSLFGRYFHYRLHPFTLPEVDKDYHQSTIDNLLEFGGFPEPFLKADKRFKRRWHQERLQRVVYEDLNDLSLVKEISLLELLVELLPEKVGSGLSVKSLQEDLEISPNTVKNWLTLLERVYYCYQILPYGPKKIRAVKKTKKLYLWDWSELEAQGAKRENFVASHLLKYCHFLEDTQGYKMELRYMKDVDGREVDFVVLQDNKPLFAVEVKTGEKSISKHIYYFRERTHIPKFYQVHFGSKHYVDDNIEVLPFGMFCKIQELV